MTVFTKTSSVVNLDFEFSPKKIKLVTSVPPSWSPLRNHLPQSILRNVTCFVKACILELDFQNIWGKWCISTSSQRVTSSETGQRGEGLLLDRK